MSAVLDVLRTEKRSSEMSGDLRDLRHTFATHALAAGLSIFEVARFMGTSMRVIDSTYGNVAHGSEQLARERLDVWALNGRGGETGTQ
jgi:integrase